MTGKIESITATIPVTGQSYTDLRPTVSADSPEEYRELLATVGELAGNAKFVERMRGQVDEQTGLSGAPVSSQSILGDGVLFNKEDHTYSKNGKPYLSGSTFAHMFEKEFPRDAIAQKVANANDRTVEDVLAGWDSKGEISLQYGTLIHKCIETFVKYGETPKNEYLAGIVGDWNEVFGDEQIDSTEMFVQDDVHQLCGVIDGLARDTIYDWKGLALDTPIPTPNGMTTMGELKEGDELYDGMGRITKVAGKSPIHHKKCYKIYFSSGEPVIADFDHNWAVEVGPNHKKTVMTTEEIYKCDKSVSIRLQPGVTHKKKSLPVDPYVLGVWLGDGKNSSGEVCISDTRIWEEILARGYRISEPQKDKRGKKCETRSIYGLIGQLKKAGVYKNKHIPEEYFTASAEQRKDLLAGLLDTDGHWHKNRREVTLDTTKDWWTKDLPRLVGSLGGKTTVCHYKTKGFGKKWSAHNFRILTLFNPFKAKDIDFTVANRAKREVAYISNIEQVESVPTQCIKVTSPEHTYLFGNDYFVTHNTGDIHQKTSHTLGKEFPNDRLSLYTLQLNFYRYICEQNGRKINHLVIGWLNGEHWEKVKVDIIDVRPYLEEVWKPTK